MSESEFNDSGISISICTETIVKVQPDDFSVTSPVLSHVQAKETREVVKDLTANSLSRGVFPERIVAVRGVKDHGFQDKSQQAFRFSDYGYVPPTRQYSLDNGLQIQTQYSKLYLGLSQTIVRMVAGHISPAVKEAFDADLDADIVEKVADRIEHFVSKHFPAEIPFLRLQSNDCTKDKTQSKYTAEFFSNILPLNIREQAKDQISSNRFKLHYHCIALTNAGARCKKHSKFSQTIFDTMLKELSDMRRPRPFSDVAKILLVVVRLVYCTVTTHLQSVENMLRTLYEDFDQDRTSPSRMNEMEGFENWLTQLGQVVQTGLTSGGSRVESDVILAKLSPSVHSHADRSESTHLLSSTGLHAETSFFLFERHLNWEQIGFESNKTIHTLTQVLQPYLKDPDKSRLSDTDLISTIRSIVQKKIQVRKKIPKGEIYIFRHLEGFGLHKIGYADNVEARLIAWQEQCGFKVDRRTDILDRIDRRVSFPKKLESLVHAELIECRYKVIQCRCQKNTNHKEWFEVDADYAQKVIAKWTRWMQEQPYNDEGEFVGNVDSLPDLGIDGLEFPSDKKDKVCELQRTRVGRKARGKSNSSNTVPRIEVVGLSTPAMNTRSRIAANKRAVSNR